MSDAHVKVYAGLSLSEAEVTRNLPGAAFAGPVRRGDVQRDLDAGVGVFVVVDGRFLQDLAVSPGELVDALRRGARVYGCSSMGAMRAVELSSEGMIGHGEIFDFIRQQAVFDDDWLGQTFHGDPPRALSVPYMDLHFALHGLSRRRVVRSAHVEAILIAAATLSFPERDRPRIVARLRERPDSAALLRSFELALAVPSQKKKDALATLKRVRKDLAEVASRNRLLDRQTSVRGRRVNAGGHR